MTIVSNSSPLIALSSVDRLDIMQLLFDTVIIPVSVRDEVMDTAAKIAVELPSFIRVNFRIAPSVLNRALFLIGEPLR